MTDEQAAPLLTADLIRWMQENVKVGCANGALRIEAPGEDRNLSKYLEAIAAIASGDAVVIPRITREALREALWQDLNVAGYEIDRIIAALKRLGINITEK